MENIEASRVGLEKLLAGWQQNRQYENMTYDGIVGDKVYWDSFPRISFLLKEASDTDFAELLTTNYPDGFEPNYPFFYNLAAWKYVVDCHVTHTNISSSGLEQKLKKPINGFGYINVKKEAGKSVSEWTDLRSYVERDAEYLRKEIEILNPHVLFCCGSSESGSSIYEFFKFLFPELKETFSSYGAHIYENNLLVVDWWHPSGPLHEYKSWDSLNEKVFNTKGVQEAIDNINWKK